jgi:hypothetical protein
MRWLHCNSEWQPSHAVELECGRYETVCTALDRPSVIQQNLVEEERTTPVRCVRAAMLGRTWRLVLSLCNKITGPKWNTQNQRLILFLFDFSPWSLPMTIFTFERNGRWGRCRCIISAASQSRRQAPQSPVKSCTIVGEQKIGEIGPWGLRSLCNLSIQYILNCGDAGSCHVAPRFVNPKSDIRRWACSTSRSC